MTITMNKQDYGFNKDEIRQCERGEFCKIMRVNDPARQDPAYFICADTTAGWTTARGRAFHATDFDGECRRTGLGVFLLIRKTETPDGGCVLEFTDDLNPDVE